MVGAGIEPLSEETNLSADGYGLMTAQDWEKRKRAYGSTALYSRLGRCRDRRTGSERNVG
jgi:hypothetical protein